MTGPIPTLKNALSGEAARARSLIERELEMVRAEAESAVKLHKWFLLAGFILGVIARQLV